MLYFDTRYTQRPKFQIYYTLEYTHVHTNGYIDAIARLRTPHTDMLTQSRARTRSQAYACTCALVTHARTHARTYSHTQTHTECEWVIRVKRQYAHISTHTNVNTTHTYHIVHVDS